MRYLVSKINARMWIIYPNDHHMNPGDFYVKYPRDFDVINHYKRKGHRGEICSFSRFKEDLPAAQLLCNKILHEGA
jgi:hypothetical protein